MQAKVTWQGRMTFTGLAGSGFPVQLGTDPLVGGDDDGLRPMELIAIGLAGCTAMDVISILKKKQQQVSGFEVRVHADTAETHPKVFTHIQIEYLVEGRNVDPAAVERAIELSKTRYCPAQAMLVKAAPIELTYKIIETA
jgi:putative redox protein